MAINVKSFTKSIKDGIKGAGETVSNYSSAFAGKGKRKKMTNEGVIREINKQYPAGLSNSAENMAIKEDIKKKFVKKLTSKNPNLLK